MKRPVILAALGVALLATTLGGCTGSAAVSTKANAVAQAAQPTKGFAGTDKADTIPVKLAVEPFLPGDNSFVVITGEEVVAVELQVIMLEMGHGLILELDKKAPGRFETLSPVIDMGGKWMLRVHLILANGEEKRVPFYGKITSQ